MVKGRSPSFNDLGYIMLGKGCRVFVFGMASIMTPVYLAFLGYSAFTIGAFLAVMIGGNIVSNITLLWFEHHIGRKVSLLLFSSLMLLAGVLLFLTTDLYVMTIAFFISNMSTTGTEAGPFQSIETGVLPRIVSVGKRNAAFGYYNLIGYAASSVGAFAASLPAYFGNHLTVFHYMYLLYGLVGFLLIVVYLQLGNVETAQVGANHKNLLNISEKARHNITKLSTLFAIDAFGGGLVSQALLSYWFFFVYGVSLKDLGLIFFIANIITAFSMIGASYIAGRLGNLRTMVFSHIISNLFLILIPLVGTLSGAVSFLFLRQASSQMDVPTRQAFMMSIFDDKERVPANVVTNTSRIISNIFGSPITGELLSLGLVSVPLILAGVTKILYDTLIYQSYRKDYR
jgi:MFS family permease